MVEFVRQVKHLMKPVASRLGQLDIELTERCNNDCIHCCINRPVNDAEARGREMTTDQIKSILTEAAGLGCLQVRFTGGEPLLRPDFEELYLYARRLGMKVLIFTNACLLTPHLADLFALIPPQVPIEVTVYGMHKESYEAISRAPGSFPKFWHGVQLLLERKVPFVVKCALLPPNRAEMDEFETWARTIPWMIKRPGYSLFFDLRNRRDDAEKNRLIESLRLSPQEGLAVLTRDTEKFCKEMAEFASKFMGPSGDVLFRCGAGCGLCIDAYGRAQPCMGVRAPELTYNLIPDLSLPRSETPQTEEGNNSLHRAAPDHETGLPAAGRGSSVIARSEVRDEAITVTHYSALAGALASFKYLRELRATNPDYLRRCAVCFLKGLCEQCPGKSWAEHGTLDTPVEYLCEVAHAQARWLGWLGGNEHGWKVMDWRERVNGKHGSVIGKGSLVSREAVSGGG
jgi:MoaA/NifB/PqqE/SkfB family radical SAM enzyme